MERDGDGQPLRRLLMCGFIQSLPVNENTNEDAYLPLGDTSQALLVQTMSAYADYISNHDAGDAAVAATPGATHDDAFLAAFRVMSVALSLQKPGALISAVPALRGPYVTADGKPDDKVGHVVGMVGSRMNIPLYAIFYDNIWSPDMPKPSSSSTASRPRLRRRRRRCSRGVAILTKRCAECDRRIATGRARFRGPHRPRGTATASPPPSCTQHVPLHARGGVTRRQQNVCGRGSGIKQHLPVRLEAAR